MTEKPIHEMTDREFRAEFGADIQQAQAAINAAPSQSDPDAWAAIWRLRSRLEPGWEPEKENVR